MADLISKIVNMGSDSESSDLKDWLTGTSGVIEIIRDKRDPVFTIVSSKVKMYLTSDTPISEEYKVRMMDKLTEVYWKVTDDFSKNFIKICMDYISESETAMSKEGLLFLNDIYKSHK
jgi:hypothetical protein